MKHKVKDLTGFAIGATDGEIGKVNEFYFDDKTWTVRYLVVETGGWLSGRKVLISPKALTMPDWESKIFRVNLTKEQVKSSPDIDTSKPVSRQQELALYSYYPWGDYWGVGLWGGGLGASGVMMPIQSPVAEPTQRNTTEKDPGAHEDPHLRSSDTITGYNIKAIDGTIGDVEDFIINDSTWKIDFIEVDTGNWFPGKKVVLSPAMIKSINWDNSEVVVNATVAQVKSSPEYDRETFRNDEYESVLKNYYGQFITRK